MGWENLSIHWTDNAMVRRKAYNVCCSCDVLFYTLPCLNISEYVLAATDRLCSFFRRSVYIRLIYWNWFPRNYIHIYYFPRQKRTLLSLLLFQFYRWFKFLLKFAHIFRFYLRVSAYVVNHWSFLQVDIFLLIDWLIDIQYLPISQSKRTYSRAHNNATPIASHFRDDTMPP